MFDFSELLVYFQTHFVDVLLAFRYAVLRKTYGFRSLTWLLLRNGKRDLPSPKDLPRNAAISQGL